MCHWTPACPCGAQLQTQHSSRAEQEEKSPPSDLLAMQHPRTLLPISASTRGCLSLPTKTPHPCLQCCCQPVSQCPTTCVNSVKLQDFFHINSPTPVPICTPTARKSIRRQLTHPARGKPPSLPRASPICIELSQNATTVTPERPFSWGKYKVQIRYGSKNQPNVVIGVIKCAWNH